jgi:hypothetical protein
MKMVGAMDGWISIYEKKEKEFEIEDIIKRNSLLLLLLLLVITFHVFRLLYI